MTAPNPGRVKYQRSQIAGYETGILTAGTPGAPSVLLLHGFSGDALTWQFTVGAIARHYRVTALDLPGHGLTDAAAGIGYWREMVGWLTRAIQHLDFTPDHLIGHSLGARILLAAAETGDVTPRSLTLISCAGISPSYDYAFLLSLTRIETLDDAVACVRHLFGDAPDNPERLAKGLYQKLAMPEAKENLLAYLASNFADGQLLPESPVAWDRVHCPLQVIWGKDDRIVQLPPSGWLPDSARIHLLNPVGHLPHITAADRVNALLLEFIRQADGDHLAAS